MRPKVSELDDASRNCPQQSWRWGELPSPPVSSNRMSPPKSISGTTSHDVSPSERGNEDGTIARTKNESVAGTEINSRQCQTTAEGITKFSKSLVFQSQ